MSQILLLLLGMTIVQVDSVYSSPAVRDIVARAAESNREAPETLHSYTARIESEAALVVHLADGEELTAQVEQIASQAAWRRDGSFSQHIVGYRAQASGPNVSAISYLDRGWTVPVLYGERLLLIARDASVQDGPESPDGPEEPDGADAAGSAGRYETVHPFSEGRDAIYRFEGGDTVAVLHLPERTVRVVRLRVTPRRAPDQRVLVFDGHVDLDADRHEIVRMRGRLAWSGPDRSVVRRVLSSGIQAFAFVEFENAEYDGRFWLPYRQRLEFQATSAVTDSRAVIRVISRFGDYRFNPPGPAEAEAADEPAFRLTFAARDTLDGYDSWGWNSGEETSRASARDFDDVAPAAFRSDGSPLLRFGTRSLSEMLRYNRVEGLYTGAGAVLAFRDAAPGLEARATAGRAWSAAALKGALELSLRRGAWEYALRGGRELAQTNDFVPPMERGVGIFMLLGGRDHFDYVDRRHATAAVLRNFGRDGESRAVLETGWTDDREEERRLLRGPYGGDTLRLNRPVAPGGYFLSRLILERNRFVNANSLWPGLGARLVLEYATGDLDWRRVEAGLQVRQNTGPFLLATRADAGLVFADAPPPQVLYELGGVNGLPGYAYKEFAGDRAVLVRTSLRYRTGILEVPLRFRGLVLPAPAPAPSVQWQAGWTSATDAAEPVVQHLGSRETTGIPSTLDVQLQFFGGMFGVGFARPLDRHARWRFAWSIAGTLQLR